MDANVEAVIRKHRERAEHGLKKYKVTTERGDLTWLQWLQHLQDELMDAAVYVQRLMADEKARQGSNAAALEKVAAIVREYMAGVNPDDAAGAFWMGHGMAVRLQAALAEVDAR